MVSLQTYRSTQSLCEVLPYNPNSYNTIFTASIQIVMMQFFFEPTNEYTHSLHDEIFVEIKAISTDIWTCKTEENFHTGVQMAKVKVSD